MVEDTDEDVVTIVQDAFIRLPKDSLRIVDAEEEIFLLYTRLSTKSTQDGSKAFTGLGFVDSRSDTLTLRFELPASVPPPLKTTKTSKRKLKNVKRGITLSEAEVLEIELAQDKTALRSRRGDTGSVLWRASVDLGQLLLRQLHSTSETSFFERNKLSESHVLELGAGTGLLSILLSPWVRHYTATDLEPLLPLIRKNLLLNQSKLRQGPTDSLSAGIISNITVDALDWVHLQSTPSHSRPSIFPLAHTAPADIILAVDCIYNPSLLPALVATLDYFAVPGRTRAIVVMELRAEDVVRDFLTLWLGNGKWEVWRVGGDGENGWMDIGYTMWVGWKVEDAKSTE